MEVTSSIIFFGDLVFLCGSMITHMLHILLGIFRCFKMFNVVTCSLNIVNFSFDKSNIVQLPPEKQYN